MRAAGQWNLLIVEIIAAVRLVCPGVLRIDGNSVLEMPLISK